MIPTMKCEYNDPQDFQGNLPLTKQDTWNFKEMKCEIDFYELIENQTTQASFFVDKSFSYGDFFLVFFLMIFSIFKIVEIIFKKFKK